MAALSWSSSSWPSSNIAGHTNSFAEEISTDGVFSESTRLLSNDHVVSPPPPHSLVNGSSVSNLDPFARRQAANPYYGTGIIPTNNNGWSGWGQLHCQNGMLGPRPPPQIQGGFYPHHNFLYRGNNYDPPTQGFHHHHHHHGHQGFHATPNAAMIMRPPLVPTAASPEYKNSLNLLIIKQIEYYFCDDNLAKDWFLRSKMNDEGWVRIDIVASFPRMQNLTSDIPMILEVLRHSSSIQVQDGNVRRRNTWWKWPKIPPSLTGSLSNAANSHISNHPKN